MSTLPFTAMSLSRSRPSTDTTYMAVDRAEMNRKLYAVLKPGGALVIADHSAKPGDGTSVGKSLHQIEEAALRHEVEAAGFKLVAQGDFWRHPEDTRDFSIQPPPGKPVDEFFVAWAQQARHVPIIGYVAPTNPLIPSRSTGAFLQRLRELGWIEGQTI